MSDRLFEIMGSTDANFYGTEDLKEIRDKQNSYEEAKYYYYENWGIVECSFGRSMKTDEYEKYQLFIFSEIMDDEKVYYIAEKVD